MYTVGYTEERKCEKNSVESERDKRGLEGKGRRGSEGAEGMKEEGER